MPTPRVEIKFIILALQGGGAHGALTWGVLDRLIEESAASPLASATCFVSTNAPASSSPIWDASSRRRGCSTASA
jgi:predicted patatin/cPLA2 family phospholipase